MNKINPKHWRIINTITTIIGLFMPWMMFYFDMQVVFKNQNPPTGWEFFFSTWRGVIDNILTYGFNLLMLPFWLVSVSGILLVLYLISNALSATKIRKHKKNKVISVILVGIVVVFLSLIFMGGTPFLGFWISNLGVLSSAILEWQE